ncbi:YtxH domain-containing protein [Chloroflexota bacterium]
MSNKDPGTSLAFGFFAGAAIGLVIGFLYAPSPGKETRELLKEKAGELKEKATGAVEKVKETAADVRKKSQQKLGEVREETT